MHYRGWICVVCVHHKGWRRLIWCLKLQVIFRTKTIIIRLFCGIRPVKIRYPMTLRNPVAKHHHDTGKHAAKHIRTWNIWKCCEVCAGFLSKLLLRVNCYAMKVFWSPRVSFSQAVVECKVFFQVHESIWKPHTSKFSCFLPMKLPTPSLQYWQWGLIKREKKRQALVNRKTWTVFSNSTRSNTVDLFKEHLSHFHVLACNHRWRWKLKEPKKKKIVFWFHIFDHKKIDPKKRSLRAFVCKCGIWTHKLLNKNSLNYRSFVRCTFTYTWLSSQSPPPPMFSMGNDYMHRLEGVMSLPIKSKKRFVGFSDLKTENKKVMSICVDSRESCLYQLFETSHTVVHLINSLDHKHKNSIHKFSCVCPSGCLSLRPSVEHT